MIDNRDRKKESIDGARIRTWSIPFCGYWSMVTVIFRSRAASESPPPPPPPPPSSSMQTNVIGTRLFLLKLVPFYHIFHAANSPLPPPRCIKTAITAVFVSSRPINIISRGENNVTKTSRKRLVGSEGGKFRYLGPSSISLKRREYFPFSPVTSYIFLVKGEKETKRRRESERERERYCMCRAPTQQSRFRVLFCCRCSAQGQGKKENENLEPIVNGVEWKRSVSAVFPEEREPRNYRPVNRNEGSLVSYSLRVYIYIYKPLCVTEERKKSRMHRNVKKSRTVPTSNRRIQTLRYVIPRSTFILASILVRRNEARCLARLIPIIHLTDCASSNDV